MHPDTIQFTVIRGDGDWRVLRDGRTSGHFDFSVDAIESALIKATIRPPGSRGWPAARPR